ncbi:LAMA5-like protein [Mya arenaria]|uniref:LAMA5-like protein n=1 Tax=Mya arenaria TaxID=6604 RepID=A0ABY7F7I2_MYAAR|nr:LAMA5-like protein [Mya arenaria]
MVTTVNILANTLIVSAIHIHTVGRVKKDIGTLVKTARLHAFLQHAHAPTIQNGYYGLESKCDKKCYSGCNVNKCYNNGTCECKANFTGSKCDLCVDGRYGANCSMQCSRGCEGNICNLRDGTCNCIRNYSGVKCEYCIEGHYGKDCLNTCSIGCFENTCSSSDGTCDCKEYYKGDKCDTCVDGKYGAYCLLQCSRGCERSTCSSTEGSCNCHIHYSGGKCENCMTGWYGDNCSKQCSQGCLDNTCSHTDGKCDCKDFYRGDKCDMCVDGMYVEQNPANKTDSVPAGVLTWGVITAVVVLVAAAALTVKRRLSQKVAKCHRTERSTTHQGEESAQTEPYEALNSSRMEESDSRDIYTRLFMTAPTAMTERVNPDCSATNMLNVIEGKAAQSNTYEP